MRTLIVGIGSDGHGDDAAGLLVARHLAGQAQPGVTVLTASRDPQSLVALEDWDAADLVVLVDAMRSGREAGTVHVLDAGNDPLDALRTSTGPGTHTLADVLDTARDELRLPAAVLVYGIEGQAFGPGTEPSLAVHDGAREAAGRIMNDVLHRDPALVVG